MHVRDKQQHASRFTSFVAPLLRTIRIDGIERADLTLTTKVYDTICCDGRRGVDKKNSCMHITRVCGGEDEMNV